MRGLGHELWMIITYALLLVFSVVIIIFSVFAENSEPASPLLGTGIICLVFTAGMLPLALSQMMSRKSNSSANQLLDIQQQQIEMLKQIHEHTMLSDSAKHIAYRRKEREMLRKAIEEDMAQEQWDAAIVLVDEMADRFGYREEAEEFRRHIEQTRADVFVHRINEAIDQFEDLLREQKWTDAYSEAAHLKRLFPTSHRVHDLEKQVRQAWEDHKHILERQFLDTASRGEYDKAMDLLKELDQYLTPREAEPYQEVARGVINSTRENLGLQFKMAVQDQDWYKARVVGESIMQEFPNSLMAREVHDRIDQIRLKSNDPLLTHVQATDTTNKLSDTETALNNLTRQMEKSQDNPEVA